MKLRKYLEFRGNFEFELKWRDGGDACVCDDATVVRMVVKFANVWVLPWRVAETGKLVGEREWGGGFGEKEKMGGWGRG